MPGERSTWLIDSLPVIEPDFLGRILAEAADVALVVSPKGFVMSAIVSPDGAPIENVDHWIGEKLADLLTDECGPKVDRVLEGVKSGTQILRLELNHRESKTWQYPVRYSVHYSDSAQGTILMLGRDLRHMAETQQQLVQAQQALERGYEERREFDARYRMLMTVTREAFVLVEVASGQIKDLNGAAALLLGGAREALQGTLIAEQFKNVTPADFIAELSTLAAKDAETSTPYKAKGTRTDVVISPVGFHAGGERLLLCRLEPEGADRPAGDHLSKNLGLLFKGGPEAIVFTDAKGVIKQANTAFLRIVNFAHHADAEGRSIADNLFRGQIDLNVLISNSATETGLKGYATRLVNDLGVDTPVEVSACQLDDAGDPTLGLVFRDTSRKEATRAPADPTGDVAHGNVVDLVGSASLKEIVSQTTDVIERMCIETAIRLTGNNRAAAAEMLGLSRQSLYVKLHKFDIQDKSGNR